MGRQGSGTANIGNTYIPAWAMIGVAGISSKVGDNYDNIGVFGFAEATGGGLIAGGLFGANDTSSGTAIGIYIKGVTSASGLTYGIYQEGGDKNYFAGNIQIGNQITIGQPVAGYIEYAKNAYYNSGWKYMVADEASLMQFANDGVISFSVAAAGAANAAITWITMLTLNSTSATVGGTISATGGNSTEWNTAYTHSQIAGGNSVHVSTTENTNWDTAYTHSQSNSQAHTDYLKNDANDSTSGTLTASNFILSSDRRMKTKIKSLLVELLDIDYKQFELKSEPGQLRFGVVAQDIQKQYPELVRKDENGMLSVAYIDLMIREITYLKNKVKYLEERIN
jgi:hypothetical protein